MRHLWKRYFVVVTSALVVLGVWSPEGRAQSQPDVAITKLDSPDPVAPGGLLTYILTVDNVSSTVATNVVITDPLPAGTSFVSCLASPGTCSQSGGGGDCHPGHPRCRGLGHCHVGGRRSSTRAVCNHRQHSHGDGYRG
jgi:uncharacterized repeat protein (TIGR01451 family)